MVEVFTAVGFVVFFAGYALLNALHPGFRLDDLLRHTYLIGGTGCGKTSLILGDIFTPWVSGKYTDNKPGCLIIETKDRESVDDILNSIPEADHCRTIVFDPYYMMEHNRYIGLNILEKNYSLHTVKTLVGGETISIFNRVWPGYIGPSSEDIIRNITLANLNADNSTILDDYRIIKDETYREEISTKIKNPVLKDYFVNGFPDPAKNQTMFNPPLNKLRSFLTDDLALYILAQGSGIDARACIEEGKIVVACLPKGLIGEPLSRLLAAILLSKFQLALFSRSDIPKAERLKRPFMFILDEFQDYCNSSLNTMLEQARSMGGALVIAHQLLQQEGIPESMIKSIFGNVGTKYIFAAPQDADRLAKELRVNYDNKEPEPFNSGVIANLPNFQCIAKRLTGGKRMPPVKQKNKFYRPPGDWADFLRERSLYEYGRPLTEIEAEINKRLKLNEVVDFEDFDGFQDLY